MEEQDDFIGWAGSLGAVAIVGAGLYLTNYPIDTYLGTHTHPHFGRYIYNYVRSHREKLACPDTDAPAMPRVHIPVSVEMSAGQGPLNSTGFWIQYAKVALWNQTKIVVPIALCKRFGFAEHFTRI